MSNNKKHHFLIADDHTIVRQGMQIAIEDTIDNFEIFTASSISQIHEQLEKNPIDIAILDAQLQDGNSFSIIPQIKKKYPKIKILIFTSYDEENYALKFIEAGADGFLSKLSEESEIKKAITQMVEKGKYLPPFTQKILDLSAQETDFLNPLNRLSEREIQIAELYAKGLGNLEIANILDIKQNTVSTYKKRIFDKLKINTWVELIELIKKHHWL